LTLGMASLGLAVAILIPVAVIEPAYVAQPTRLLPALPAMARPAVASFASEVDLVGYAWPSGDWHPGDTVPLRLYWRRGASPAHPLSFDAQLVDYRGQVVTGADASLAPTLPLAEWPRDRVVEIGLALHLPTGTSVPQLLRFDVGVYTMANGAIEHLATEGGAESIGLGPVRLVGAARSAARPAVARFGSPGSGSDVVALMDWSVDRAGAHAGATLRGELIWSAETTLRIDYTVFVHLVRDGKLIAQHDAPPRDGAYPTTAWRPGEVVPDAFSLSLPADLTPGPATLEIGLYDLTTLRRLPLSGGDSWNLATIEIGPG
jgi:hypothetical protein